MLLFRKDGFALVLEQSADMVPGMLHSRLRPGLNHLAFALPDGRDPGALVVDAVARGWTLLESDGHPIAGGADVVFLEDADGFEVELVAPVGVAVVAAVGCTAVAAAATPPRSSPALTMPALVLVNMFMRTPESLLGSCDWSSVDDPGPNDQDALG